MDGKKPMEMVVVQRLDDAGAPSETLVVRIAPTTSMTNAILELLKHCRREYPGAWYLAEEWIRRTLHGPITVSEVAAKWPLVMPKENVPKASKDVIEGIKEVSRSHFGLPDDDSLEDVPV